ncbi:MAG: hypothetical protein EB148_05505 [Actinobacteria bacterium]|nr:hypothetical protein [Actinomycetota bacterium]
MTASSSGDRFKSAPRALPKANGSDGCDKTGATIVSSSIMPRANPPLKHIPTAPTPLPPTSTCTRVPLSQVQPGDLLFSQSTFFHVGIYIGNGQMIHAPRTGDVVKISTVTWTRVLGVGRPK